MVSETQVRCVALFFLFAFTDESVALPAADRTIATLKNKLGRFAEESSDAKQILVSSCLSYFEKHKKGVDRNQVSEALGAVLRTPAQVDMRTWEKFRRDAGEEELLAVIFGRILDIPTSDVAAAMSISEGTAHYRLSRGIVRLGEIDRALHPGEA